MILIRLKGAPRPESNVEHLGLVPGLELQHHQRPEESSAPKGAGALDVAGFWKLLKKHIFDSGPGPRNPPNRPGKAAPDPPDIVERPQEIVGRPQGVQGKTLIFNIKYLPKARHVNAETGSKRAPPC